MSNQLYEIALMKIPKIGAVTAKNLISYCGGAEEVFRAKKKDLLHIPGIGLSLAENILTQDVLLWAEKEVQFLEKNNIQAISYTDKRYPQRLRNYNDSPLVLHYKGNADLNQTRVIAIVGTRSPTSYGKMMCEELVEGLKPYNILLVSGLAYGIDVTAHRHCLEHGIETIGVLGHGLKKIYPSAHRSIAEQMTECGGLLTEYPSDEEPDREHFPARNRIIAGMCDALIVVETALKGGSMISAEVANEYNKDVFAVPGKVRDKFSQGCNLLIKNHKAQLIESAADLVAMLRWEQEEENEQRKIIQQKLFVELDEYEQRIMNILAAAEDAGVVIDKISYQSGFSSSETSALLLGLEFQGLVRTLPGKRYVKI